MTPRPTRALSKRRPPPVVVSAAVAAEEAAVLESDTSTLPREATETKRVVSRGLLRQLNKLQHAVHEALDKDSYDERAKILASGDDPLMQVVLLHRPSVQHVKTAMDELHRRSPLISRIVQNLHATNVALFGQRKEIIHLRHKGELAEADATALCDEVNRKLKALYHRPMADWGVSEEQLAHRRSERMIESQRRNVGKFRAAVAISQLNSHVRESQGGVARALDASAAEGGLWEANERAAMTRELRGSLKDLHRHQSTRSMGQPAHRGSVLGAFKGRSMKSFSTAAKPSTSTAPTALSTKGKAYLATAPSSSKQAESPSLTTAPSSSKQAESPSLTA